jgi:glucose/arabinose dehydrogenase
VPELLAFLAMLIVGSMSIGLWTAGISAAAPPPPKSNAPLVDGTETLPPGVTIDTILPGMNLPIAMAFDPDNRLFYTEKSGAVRLFANGVLQPNPVITFSVNNNFERGLLGIAIDPNFSTNHYIYVYYTASAASENRVVRFEENNGIGSNPVTIFTSPQTAGNHVGGNIHFGTDGKLYISIGDNANAANAQNVTVTNGKMHRINPPDGSIPPDNPVFTYTNALPSLYAMGLRNSFDFTFDPLTPPNPYQRIFASENGPGCDDEMNRIEPAYNYGWRSSYPCDDNNPSPQYNTIRPLWWLGTGGGGACCEAPTGIMVYIGTQIPEWTGHLFMANYNSGDLRHFYLDETRTVLTQTNRVLGINANMDLINGPDGAFWYIEGGGYGPGTLKRIRAAGPTFTPTVTWTPTPTPLSPTVTRTSCVTPSYTHTHTATSTPSNTPGPGTPTDTPTSTFTVTRTPTFCPMTFTDVVPSDYFYEAVRYLYCAGVISGYSDNTFRPYNDTTRGQMTKIVVLAFAYPIYAPPQPTFSDVPASHTFYQYIETAAYNEIVSGYSDGTFRPQNNVTRGQLSKIVVIAAQWPPISPTEPTFSDVPIGSPFYEYVETAYDRGIISGYADGTFRPQNNATRGQIAKIVHSALLAP